MSDVIEPTAAIVRKVLEESGSLVGVITTTLFSPLMVYLIQRTARLWGRVERMAAEIESLKRVEEYRAAGNVKIHVHEGKEKRVVKDNANN